MPLCSVPRGLLVLVICSTFVLTAAAQQKQTPSIQNDEVIKVNTVLVQTDVMVFDRHGSFVDGLKRDQFGLKIDGKPREISFFEKIQAGSPNEEAQLTAARGNAAANPSAADGAVPLDR